MGKCFVPFCNTGYKSCKTKHSPFTPPDDGARLEAWRRAIPRKDRVPQRTDRVCEWHFAPHFVLRTSSAEIYGRVLSGKRRVGLAKDAVPSIFEGAPGYLSRKIKSPRKQVKRRACPLTSTAAVRESSSANAKPRSSPETAVAEHSAANVADTGGNVAEAPEANEASKHSSFDDLFTSASNMPLPTPTWAVHRIEAEGLKGIVFNDASVLHNGSDRSCQLFNKRTLHVKSNMAVQVYILGKPDDASAVGISAFAASQADVQNIRTVADFDICSGSPSLKDFPTLALECVYTDCQRKWRRKKCPLVSPGAPICPQCSGLADTLRIHPDRQAARAKQKQPLKRIRLSVPRSSVQPAQQAKLGAFAPCQGCFTPVTSKAVEAESTHNKVAARQQK